MCKDYYTTLYHFLQDKLVHLGGFPAWQPTRVQVILGEQT